MQVLQEGRHPNERTCPACGTRFIYDKKEVDFKKGKPGKVVDKFRYEVVYYPKARYCVYCPLCGQEIVVKRVSGYSVESVEFW